MDKLELRKMNAFNNCPKCNCEGAARKYIPPSSPGQMLKLNDELYSLEGIPEFILRTCLECGYEWAEEVYS